MSEYTVLVNYKSGRQVEFECDKFDITGQGGRFSWTPAEDSEVVPIWLNIAEVESVWQRYAPDSSSS